MRDKYQINRSLFQRILGHIENMDSEAFIYRDRPEHVLVRVENPDPRNSTTYSIAHSHPFNELFIVLDGSVNIHLDHRYYYGTTGNVCYIEGGTFHSIKIANWGGENFIYWVALDQKRLRMHISYYVRSEYHVVDGIDIDFEPYLLARINDELTNKPHDYLQFVKSYLTTFWRLVLRGYERDELIGDSKHNWRSRIILEIEEYVFNHISGKITLKDISDSVEMSPNYLSQLFKEYKRINLFEYIMQKRIEYSKELLSTSKQTISEIAYVVGFSDPFYFSKVFKKATGLTPRDFRNSRAAV